MSSKHIGMSRRKFLAGSAKTAAGMVAATAARSFAAPQGGRSVIGANERINTAVLGIRGQGRHHIRQMAEKDNVSVKTLCDPDENLFGERVKLAEEIQDFAPKTEYDLRRVFEDKDIDAVTIATCNHWHALATIWACQAGKHVYVEKPASHNIWEGRKMVEAARKYNRIVQVGTQRRGNGRKMQQAIRFLHDGGIGEVYMARGLCTKPRGDIGIDKDSPVPDGVHYDIWLGPAPWRPFNPGRFHYDWHWFWDTGNGDIGNTGPHQLDVARWGLAEQGHPVKVHSVGGYFAWKGAQQTPNTQTALYEYADGKLLQFDLRNLCTNSEEDIEEEGNIFYGTKGWMCIDDGDRWKTYFGRKNEPGPDWKTAEKENFPGDEVVGGGHFGNFIYAIRSGSREHLACDVEVGHISTALSHLANISYRLGRGVTFDGAREKFVGDEEANRMLSRKYRKPYVVPVQV